MSATANISVTQDNATPAIARLMERTQPARLAQVCRQPLETFLRVHLRSLPTNKRGWPSTGFWESASRGTIGTANDDGSILLQVNKLGVRQRLYGGPILPVEAKALAIPISPVSYGHLPREFPGLFLLKTAKGAYLVQAGTGISEKTGGEVKGRRLGGNSKRRQTAGLNFLFKLSGGVNQAPNPDVLPTNDQFQEVAMESIQRSLAE